MVEMFPDCLSGVYSPEHGVGRFAYRPNIGEIQRFRPYLRDGVLPIRLMKISLHQLDSQGKFAVYVWGVL